MFFHLWDASQETRSCCGLQSHDSPLPSFLFSLCIRLWWRCSGCFFSDEWASCVYSTKQDGQAIARKVQFDLDFWARLEEVFLGTIWPWTFVFLKASWNCSKNSSYASTTNEIQAWALNKGTYMAFGSTNNTKSQLGGSPCNSSRKTSRNYDKMGYRVKTIPPQYAYSSPSWDLFSTTIMIQIARIQPCFSLSRQ